VLPPRANHRDWQRQNRLNWRHFIPALTQRLAGHADPRTTRLYDRRDEKITRNIVERISV